MEENKTSVLEQRVVAVFHPMLFLQEVLNRLVIIILIAITVMSCTYIFVTYTYSPVYQTNTTFVVSTRSGASSALSNLSTAKGLASSLSQVLNSDLMKKRIAEALEVDRVDGTIEAAAIDETNLLELSVTGNTPREAFMITSALLDNYPSVVDQILGDVVMDVLQHPTVPTAPINPLRVKNTVVLAGIASIVLTIAVLGIIFYLRDTVKTEEEAKEKLDIKVLGIIRHENKYKTFKSKIEHKKTGILVSNPTTGFDFVETFRKLRTRVDYSMRKKNYKTLMVSSVMEDEGKSTVAVNLALTMKKKYENVLLIEADLRKPSLHKILEYQDKDYISITEVLKGNVKLEDAIITDEASGIKLLLSSKGTSLSHELLGSENMRKLMAQVKETMDVVILDTPPMVVGIDAESVAEVADAAILVVRQDLAPVRIINDMIDELNASSAGLLGSVLNDFRSTDIDDSFSYGRNRYGYGKYGYGKYGYGKYGYGYGDNGDKQSGFAPDDREGM